MRSKERNKEYDKAYMRMAEVFSDLSYAKRNKVGAIIVSKNDQVISQGYNGTPTGFDNICEDVECTSNYRYGCVKCCKPITDVKSIEYCSECNYAKLVTKPEVLHAEANAITKCAKNCISTKNGTIYVTLSPCIECAKLIIQSEIKRVVYRDIYRNIDGIKLLEKTGVKVQKFDEI